MSLKLFICTNKCACTCFKVETGSDQSAYPGQMGHFFSSSCGLPSNEGKPDHPAYIFKMVTVESIFKYQTVTIYVLIMLSI